MTQASILQTLQGVDFLHDMEAEHLGRLAEICRPVEFPAQHTIFSEHDVAKDVYVILKGKVSLVICLPKVGCRQLMQVGDGELIGWSPLVDRHRLSDTAFTVTPTAALAIDGEKLLALCATYTPFGYEFMHRVANVLARRLAATRQQLMQNCGFQLPDIQIESD